VYVNKKQLVYLYLNREDHGCKSVDEAFKYVLAEVRQLTD